MGGRDDYEIDIEANEIDGDRNVIVNKAIFEHDRRKQHGGRFHFAIMLVLSILLAAGAVAAVTVLQYEEYKALIKGENITFYSDQVTYYCEVIDFKNFDVLSTPISILLVIILIILYKRRSFLRKKCKFSYFGLPMIVSAWNKTDRIYTTIVYGRIAKEVFKIIYDSLEGEPGISIPNDPTGLGKLLIKIIEVFLIGIRYYPVLVAYRVKVPIVYLLTAIFMWIDFTSTFYELSVCDGFTREVMEDEIASETYESIVEDANQTITPWMVYTVLDAIPSFFFSSFICITLTYRAVTGFIDKCRRKSSEGCCTIIKIRDNIEIIYSQYDIDYVMELLHKKPKKIEEKSAKNRKSKIPLLQKCLKNRKNTETTEENEENLTQIDVTPKQKLSFKEKVVNFLKKKIYNWDPNFRFSSRYLACQTVALVTLYYFAVTFMYYAYEKLITLDSLIPTSVKVADPYNTSLVEFFCALTKAEEMCGDEGFLRDFEDFIPIHVPPRFIYFFPELLPSLKSAIIVPAFAALIICCVQLFFSVRDTRTHLLQLYRGECDYVPRRKLLSNPSIASSSFHFGGYLVGYLIWGYLLQYIFITIIAFVILFIRIFIGDRIFGTWAFAYIPVISVLIVKKIVNTYASRVAFLNRGTKILSIDNFRAFNVFLYFSFFFDCFMGFLSAITRIIKSAVFNIFMMPRISYGFLGRQFERKDNGYSTYVGFLYMEASHTNPIVVCFCNILYYKGLSEHIREQLKNGEKKLQKFRGSIKETALKTMPKKHYKKHIVNKWHVMYMLTKNPILVAFRKEKK